MEQLRLDLIRPVRRFQRRSESDECILEISRPARQASRSVTQPAPTHLGPPPGR
jgi:hypothetical protein